MPETLKNFHMGSHLTFNYLRYKLLYPFCRRSIRWWEGKNLALDLTSWTCSGSNSHTTIFPPSRLPLHHRFIPYRVGEQICPQELWEQKVQRAKPEYQPIANICQTHFLEEREGKVYRPTSRRNLSLGATCQPAWWRPVTLASGLVPWLACLLGSLPASLWPLAEQHLKESPWFSLEGLGKRRPGILSWAALQILFLILGVGLFIWRSKMSGNTKATDQKKKKKKNP